LFKVNKKLKKRIFLSPPHMSGKELFYVKEAFKSNYIAPLGPQVDAFEKEMCNYTGASHAVALSSGTAALHLALIVSGIKKGDEVICSSFTFAGSAFPVVHTGATPVFVDSNQKTWNMDPMLLEKAIVDRSKKGKKPKAVIVVHLYGQSADMDSIVEICNRYDVLLIEDAAESLGAFYKKKHTGTIAPLGVFSFNGNKIITTSGGGMLIGHNQKQIEKARFYSTQARDPAPHYEHTEIGYNYRMSNILAAIGRGQLESIEDRVKRRREIFSIYQEELSGIPGISFMPEIKCGRSNRWLTCITIDPQKSGTDRETIRLALEAKNTESRPLWKPMHMQPVFRNCPAYVNGLSEGLFKNGLCLPSGTTLTKDDLKLISGVIKKAIRKCK
jgi:dTDP-4-amino-4,6-dideoxygalactose transaminase